MMHKFGRNPLNSKTVSIFQEKLSRQFRRCPTKLALLIALGLAGALPLPAQAPRGPLPPPPPGASSPSVPQPVPASRPARNESRDSGESPLVKDPPAKPVEQIIQSFAQREAQFRVERGNYTYSQTFLVESLDADGIPNGQYRLDSDILFTPQGQRYENITYAPVPNLQGIELSEQDLNDLKNIQPFVLTTEELPKYDITYVGRQHVDEISTYVFDVAPKAIEKGQRYFLGRIWVDEKDLEIVKTYGKAAPDMINKDNRYYTGETKYVIFKKGEENIFPHFETYRQNITGPYWFPVYTHGDDTLNFSNGPVRIRFTVRYSNYKRFGSTVKIGKPIEIKQP
jgi:hypothetical protein